MPARPFALLSSFSDMSYMKMIQDDIDGTIQSAKACATVVLRFPGICRFRRRLAFQPTVCLCLAFHQLYVYDLANSRIIWGRTSGLICSVVRSCLRVSPRQVYSFAACRLQTAGGVFALIRSICLFMPKLHPLLHNISLFSECENIITFMPIKSPLDAYCFPGC